MNQRGKDKCQCKHVNFIISQLCFEFLVLKIRVSGIKQLPEGNTIKVKCLYGRSYFLMADIMYVFYDPMLNFFCFLPHMFLQFLCRNMWVIWTKTEGAKSSRKKYHIWYLWSLQFHRWASWFECISVNLPLSLSLCATYFIILLELSAVLQLRSLNSGLPSIWSTVDQAENTAALEEIGSVIFKNRYSDILMTAEVWNVFFSCNSLFQIVSLF